MQSLTHEMRRHLRNLEAKPMRAPFFGWTLSGYGFHANVYRALVRRGLAEERTIGIGDQTEPEFRIVRK